MSKSPLPALVVASLWALPAAVLTSISLALAAPFVALGMGSALALRGRHRLAGLIALPACLAAIAPPLGTAPRLEPGPALVTGVVRGVVRAPDTGAVAVRLGRERPSLRLTLDEDLEVFPGDLLTVHAHVAAPAAPDLPGNIHGVAATAQITAGAWSLARIAAVARRRLEQELLDRIRSPNGAMLASLVLGRDTRPAGELVAAHRATGLSHLLAVSGAHAAMLAFLLGMCSWHGRRRVGNSKMRTASVLLLLLAYAAVTGNEPPVLRAVAAYALAAAAAHCGRPCGIAPVLVAPAILTGFVQSDALLGPSFLLSYAAVVGLVFAGAPHHDTWFARWIAAPLRASAWATLLTAPLTLWFFAQLAPWTVVLTPLLAPLVGLLLLLGLATAVFGVIAPGLADGLAQPVDALTGLYGGIVRAADRLPGTPILAAFAPEPWFALLAVLAAIVLVLWRRDRVAVALAAVVLTTPYFVPPPGRAPASLQLFAVGHGQACLVHDRDGHQTAIDCGSLQHPFLAAERLTHAMRVRRLDLLVITHADLDHHNGVPGLLARVPIARAVLPATLAHSDLAARLIAHGTLVRVLAAGETYVATPTLRVTAPPVPEGASDNDRSLWTSLHLGATSVLSTGDAQELGVATAIAAGIATPHDILVLPHHGRANANGWNLLRAVMPRACLASAATGDGETECGGLARRLGADLWVTGLHGSVKVFGEPPRLLGDQDGRPLPPSPVPPR